VKGSIQEMKRGFSMIFLLVLIGLGLQAETIFVSVLEQTPDMELHNFEASIAWESGVLDALFDMGAIVSNTPIQSVSAFDTTEALQTAKEGGAETVLVVVLQYSVIPEEKSKLRAVPGAIQFSLYTIKTGQLMKQIQFRPSKTSDSVDEDKQIAKQQTRFFMDIVRYGPKGT